MSQRMNVYARVMADLPYALRGPWEGFKFTYVGNFSNASNRLCGAMCRLIHVNLVVIDIFLGERHCFTPAKPMEGQWSRILKNYYEWRCFLASRCILKNENITATHD